MMIFTDRVQAGRMLAERLEAYANRKDVTVLGIPRGGVPVAFEIAEALDAQLDVFVARKLGVPGQEELAFGAIASGGVRVLDPKIVGALGISSFDIEEVTARERKELERRERLYRGARAPLDIRDALRSWWTTVSRQAPVSVRLFRPCAISTRRNW